MTIAGTGFNSAGTTQVEIGIPGNVALYPATAPNATTASFNAPALPAGLKTIRVRNPDGQFSPIFQIHYVAPPSSFSLTGYWEQRADVSSYSPTDTDGAGVDVAAIWEGRASAGVSLGRNLVVDATFTTAPTLAATVNGGAPVDFTAVARGLRSALTPSSFMPTANVFTVVQLVKITAQPGATFNAGTPAAGEKILAPSLGGLQLAITKEGATGNVVASFVATDNVGSASVAIGAIPLNTWTLLIGRVNGTSLKMRRNAGSDASGTMPGTGAIVNQASGEMRDADNANGTVIRHELLRSYPGAFTDAQCAQLYQYLSRYQYPDAGLALVALAAVPTLTTFALAARPTASAPETGVATPMTVTGTGFLPGVMQVEINATFYPLTYVSATSATFTSDVAIAKGTYSFRVQNTDGQFSAFHSGGIRFVAQTAARTLSLWTGQGRGSDFAPAAAPPYTSMASAGTSGGRSLIDFGTPYSLPTVGTAVDSTTQVRFGTDLKDLKSALTLGNFLTGSAFTIAMLVKLDATVAAWTGTATGTMLFYGTFVNIQAGQTGGLGRVTLHTVSGVDNFINSPTFALGSYVGIIARYDGTNIRMRVNAVDSVNVAAANLNAAFSTQTVRMAHPSNGMAIHDRLSLILSPTAWSDAECTDQFENWKFHGFPTAGLP